MYAGTDDHVHAVEVRDARRLLFVSGTMGCGERPVEIEVTAAG